MRLLILALFGAIVGACDPCSAVIEIHQARCAAGDPVSCAWMEDHLDPTTGQCPG